MRDRFCWEGSWKGRYWEGRIPPAWRLDALLSALADILTTQARYEEAEKLLRRLLDLAGFANAKVQAAARLAKVLRKMGRADEADEIESDAATDLYRELRGD